MATLTNTVYLKYVYMYVNSECALAQENENDLKSKGGDILSSSVMGTIRHKSCKECNDSYTECLSTNRQGYPRSSQTIE